jgi:mannose-6-phosphate isomerase-like protein (cupin superfamily)
MTTIARSVCLVALLGIGSALPLAAPPGVKDAAPSATPGPDDGTRPRAGSRIERDAEVAVEQPGTHDGGGLTTGYPFFGDVDDMPFYFRKRALHPGSGVGLHVQEQDEVYYVLSGTGDYTLDGKVYPVGAGTAMLTRKGSAHALKQTGREDLVILIAYPREPGTR